MNLVLPVELMGRVETRVDAEVGNMLYLYHLSKESSEHFPVLRLGHGEKMLASLAIDDLQLTC